jgi:undecaprenyl-diphosphatase
VAPHEPADPTVARASPAGWRAWLFALVLRGWDRLAALGLALLLGFGAGLLALYWFALLAEEVMERDTALLDDAVLAALRQFQSPVADAAAHVISFLGSEMVAILLVLGLVLLGLRGRWGAAVGLLLVTVGAQLLNNVLKELFQRTRPAPVEWLAVPAQVWSFPSGHAMVAAAFYLFLAYLSWRVLRGGVRWVWTGGLLLLVLAIGLSRLYLGVHYVTDVVAGYLAGFLWTDAVIVGGHLLERRRARRLAPVGTGRDQPPAAERPGAGDELHA